MEDLPQRKQLTKDSVVELKQVQVSEDGGKGHPEDQTFTAEIVDKADGEEKQPLKSETLGSGEGAVAQKAAAEGTEAETTAAVQSKTHEPSLWWAICRTFYKPFILSSFFKLGHDILLFVSPMLLK